MNTKGYQVINTDNSLPLKGSTSGITTLSGGTAITDYQITLPNIQGAVNTTLGNDGAGNLTWVAAATGNVAGPISSTDRAIATWNGVAGSALFNNSTVKILAGGNLQLLGNSAYTQVASPVLPTAGGQQIWNSLFIDYTDPGANSASVVIGLDVNPQGPAAFTHNMQELVSIQARPVALPANGHSIASMVGVWGRPENAGVAGSTGAQMVAFRADGDITSGSTVTDWVGYYAFAPTVSGGSILTNAYGLQIEDLTGTATNTYGLVIEKATSAGLWLKKGSRIIMDGSTSGSITFDVVPSVSSYGIIWPAAQGAAGTGLQNDGAGNLTWVSTAFNGNLGNGLFVEGYLAPMPLAGTFNLNDFDMTFTSPGAPTTAAMNGLRVKESYGASWVAGGGDYIGVLSNIVNSAAGFTFSSQTGFKSSMQSAGASTITIVRGYESLGSFTHVGNIVTNYEAYHVSAPTTGGTITNAYGLYIDNLTSGTNNYGIYIDGASTYAIWSNSGINRFDGDILTTHVVGQDTPPVPTAGTGSGSGTPSLTGTDIAGTVSVLTGVAPTAGAAIVTVTFTSGYSTAPYVQLTPANAATALLSGVTMVYVTETTTTFVINAGSAALVGLTTYAWNYETIG